MVERSPRDPLDEEAAWAQIVAGYGEQPQFPTAQDDAREAEPHETEHGAVREDGPDAPAGRNGAATGAAEGDAAGGTEGGDGADDRAENGPRQAGPSGTGGDGQVGSFVVYAPGVGPRDWSAAEPSDDDFDESDDGHFTPPEPPPLPQADVTTKFAWIAVLGGPLLLVGMVLFQQPVTWWITVLGIGGFLGGFATLVARMRHDDDDDDPLPGGGAVV